LLFCFAVTNAARKTQTQLWKTQMQLRKICKQSCTVFWKLMCVRTQCSLKEDFRVFRRNFMILRRSLLICGRSLPICRRTLPICSASCTANTSQKNVPNVGVIFFTRTVHWCSLVQSSGDLLVYLKRFVKALSVLVNHLLSISILG